MAYSYDGLDLTVAPYGVLNRPQLLRPPRAVSRYASGVRAGGVISSITEGIAVLPLEIEVIGSSASDLEAQIDTLYRRLSRPERRLVAGFQDARYSLATMTGWELVSIEGPLVAVVRATFEVGDPYALAPATSGNVATPSFTSVLDPSVGGGDAYGDRILALSPRCYLRLGEAAGATTAVDASGQGWHFSYIGTPSLGVTGLIASNSNTAVDLNGSSHSLYLNVAQFWTGTSNKLSMEFWVNRDGAGTLQYLFDTAVTSWPRLYFDAANNVVLSSPALGTITTSTVTLADTASAHHIVVTRDGGSAVKLWIDGVDRTGAVTNNLWDMTSFSRVYLGRLYSAASNFLNAVLDEVAFYDYALSAQQVSDNYQLGLASIPTRHANQVALTPGGTARAPLRVIAVNKVASVTTPTSWRLSNVSAQPSPVRAQVTADVPPGSVLLWDGDRGRVIVASMASVVGWYPAEDASGSLTDFAGNDRDLTVSGAPVFRQPAARGGGVLYDGVDDYHSSASTAFNLSANLSMVAWITQTAIGAVRGIMSKAANANTGYELGLDASGYVVARIGNGTSTRTATSVIPVAAGERTLVVVTFTQSTGEILIYLNGVQAGRDAGGAFTPAVAANSFAVGRAHQVTNGNINYFNGVIDEAAVCSVALTAAQVRAIYQGELPDAFGTAYRPEGALPELDPRPSGAANTVELAAFSLSVTAPTVRVAHSWTARWA